MATIAQEGDHHAQQEHRRQCQRVTHPAGPGRFPESTEREKPHARLTGTRVRRSSNSHLRRPIGPAVNSVNRVAFVVANTGAIASTRHAARSSRLICMAGLVDDVTFSKIPQAPARPANSRNPDPPSVVRSVLESALLRQPP